MVLIDASPRSFLCPMPGLEGVTVALTATVTVSLPMNLTLVTALMVDGATTAYPDMLGGYAVERCLSRCWRGN